MAAAAASIEAQVAAVFRQQAGRVTAALIRRFRDFDLAEESTQDALLSALQTWPKDGVPTRPGAWLMTVASRLALNRLSRAKLYREKLAQLVVEPSLSDTDDRLRLILTCCHPALSREAQVGLTLRAVCGFTTAQIARAFLCSESTVAQRLVRAKRRIAAAGIPYRVPSDDEIPDRLTEVLAVLYLMFNEAHLSTDGELAFQRDLADDAMWLATLLHRLLPDQPEIMGLLALMQLHLARRDSRFTDAGHIVLLADQDRRRWDRELIRKSVRMIECAAAMGRPGPYQLEAAIAACHLEAESFGQTDWEQVLVLYDMLLAIAPSPVVRMNRAIAFWKVKDAAAALVELDALGTALDDYHLFHAARGQMLSALGRCAEAEDAHRRALTLARNDAERSLIGGRLFN